MQKALTDYKRKLRDKMSILDFAHISSKFLLKNNKNLNKIRLTQEKKLFNLGLRTATETNDPTKVIFNFSNRELTDSEKKLLVKGLNLSIPPKSLNYADFLAPFEFLYTKLLKAHPNGIDNSTADPLRAGNQRLSI